MLYFVLIVTIFREVSADGPRCFECTRIPFPRDCDHVAVCGDHETCYTKQIVSDNGHVYYNSGCLDKQKCMAKRSAEAYVRRTTNDITASQSDETGDLVTCLSCCHGEFCNLGGCGSSGLSSTNRGPICFSCPKGSTSTESCDKLTMCSRDQRCSTQQFHGVGGDLLYKMGCVHSCTTTSTEAGVLVGKRDTSCFGCCDTDFCNSNCSALNQHAAVTPSKPTSHDIANTSPTASTSTNSATSLKTTLIRPTKPTQTSTTPTVTTPDIDKSTLCSQLPAGYTYLEEYDHCIKIYNNVKLTWFQSRDQCKRDGGNLVIFHNKREEKFFESLTERPTDDVFTKRYWVGASDLEQESHWVWSDNTPVSRIYFYPNEPNSGNHKYEEDCGATGFYNRTFLINDDDCTNQYHFICEMNIPASHNKTTTTTPTSRQCRNSHYSYTASLGACFHVYDDRELTMDLARQACQSEHGDLLQLPDANAEQFFIDYLFKDKENNNIRYWLGARKHNDGQFYWLNGHLLDDSLVWVPGQPDNYQHSEKCLDVTWFAGSDIDHTQDAFALNDDNCAKSLFFICEET